MPIRKTPLVNNHYYHLFNRSIAKVPIFRFLQDCRYAKEAIAYYRFKKPILPLSKFNILALPRKKEILNDLEKDKNYLVEIVAYCLMPNHYHFLIKQRKENGISIFLGNFQNSYARYFNLKHRRSGGLFQNAFKSVLIEDDDQLLHISRYIHLNPYTSFIVKRLSDIGKYPWSSLAQYLDKNQGVCNPEPVLCQFKTPEKYKKFVFDQADYQRNLAKIKHLVSE